MYKKYYMKTKEDILKEKAGIYQFTNGWTFEDEQKLIKAIHEAMEEYAEQFRLFDFSDTVLPNIKIEIKDKNVNITTNSIEHDDVVMFWLIESIYALRNKQYSQFRQK